MDSKKVKNKVTLITLFFLSLLALWLWLSHGEESKPSTTTTESPVNNMPENRTPITEKKTNPEMPTSENLSAANKGPTKNHQASCHLNDQELPEWNEGFAAAFIAEHPQFGLTVKDLAIFKNLQPEFMQLMWMPFSAFDENEMVSIDFYQEAAPFVGQSLSQVRLAAEKGDAIARSLLGSHLMHRAYNSGLPFDAEKYDEGQRLLLQSASQGHREALMSLRLHALLAHRIVWRKASNENIALYQKLKAEYLALNELTQEHGTPAMSLAHLIDNDLISDQLSTSGLSEPFPNTETLAQRDELKSRFRQDMQFAPLSIEQQEDKDRLAWLVRNTDLSMFADAFDKACRETHKE